MPLPAAVGAALAVGGALAALQALRLAVRRSDALRRLCSLSGVSVSSFQIGWRSTAAVRAFEAVARRAPRFWRAWFGAGMAVALASMVVAVALLVMTLCGAFGRLVARVGGASASAATAAAGPGQLEFTPVIPGVNLPLDQLPYYAMALAMSVVLHELGHGVAAVVCALWVVRAPGC